MLFLWVLAKKFYAASAPKYVGNFMLQLLQCMSDICPKNITGENPPDSATFL